MKKITTFCGLLLCANLLFAQNSGSHFIRLDQFGYLPDSKKVAVIADPVVGFDAAQSFNPGNTYQVVRAIDNQVVFTSAPVSWKNGATHTQSGDKGWWFDFSAVTTPGEYYLRDVVQNVSSYHFKIGPDVYRDVLKQAVRMYFYQRLGFAKQSPFADAKWADGLSFEGPNQDKAARSRWAKTDASTARDLHGGWMDAGDVNKYTTFAEGAVLQLLEAYRRNPAAFSDDFNIPESGNGIPDLLDELRWELDFLKRMQDATGTNGFILKVGVDNYNDVSPPSTDTRPRYYLPECTSATLSGCAMFAQAGVVFKNSIYAVLQTEGADLIQRAELAWQRAAAKTANFTQFETACDDGDIKAGDADRDNEGQLESAVTAAVYLYEATNDVQYKNFVETKYTAVKPISNTWWGPYQPAIQYALLRFTTMPNVNPAVALAIRNQKAAMNYTFSIDNYQAETDLYRAHMNDSDHNWGSNLTRANCGNLNLDFANYNINPTQAAQYQEIASQYLHWLHGANPLGITMLTNMYAFGGDACVNEIYHTWFGNNTPYDNALTSPKGPPPGYLTGGPNKYFSATQLVPPAGQPAQKCYLDFNDGWPQNSWEITEPAIYYNAGYILLLSNFALNASSTETQAPVKRPPSDFSIFPNPASDSFTIRFTDTGLRDMRLVDQNGKTVWEKQTTENQVKVEVKSLPVGVYELGVNGSWKQFIKQ